MLLPDAAVKLQGDNYRPRQTLDIPYVPVAYVLTSLLEIMSLNLMETIPLCDIIQSYTNIYVNTLLFLF